MNFVGVQGRELESSIIYSNRVAVWTAGGHTRAVIGVTAVSGCRAESAASRVLSTYAPTYIFHLRFNMVGCLVKKVVGY